MERPIIDVAEGLGRVLNNKALYQRILQAFDGKKAASQIAEAMAAQDLAAVGTEAHALKGVAANLAMHPLAELASQVETHAKAGTLSAAWVAQLYEMLDAVAAEIALVLAEGLDT